MTKCYLTHISLEIIFPCSFWYHFTLTQYNVNRLDSRYLLGPFLFRQDFYILDFYFKCNEGTARSCRRCTGRLKESRLVWENQGLTLTLQQFEFVAERRVGTKESSGRGENGMCKVTYCLYSNSKREWARNREVVFPINGQGRPGEAFPLGKVPNPQQCTNEEKAPPRPRPCILLQADA